MAKSTFHILVVDDELSMREMLEYLLTKQGYRVTCAESGKRAVQLLGENRYDLLICDIRLGDITGLDVLRASKARHPETVVIMISAYVTTEVAVEAMNEGAYDYVPKPFDNEELRTTIANALELKTIEQEKESIDDQVKQNIHFRKIVGNSPSMMHIFKMIQQVACTRTNVLVTGESGTGKELIARAIHDESPRAGKPFVAINCGGIPENLMESELFGHMKGSFTGATHDKKGLFEAAHKGTVFLDEIGELGMALQVKLLRAVQEKAFKPVGSNEDVEVDCRIISATNKNLAKEVIEGRFREDLFYRLNILALRLPPLRERPEDLPLLAARFARAALARLGVTEAGAVDGLLAALLPHVTGYAWPGNIRELENLVERAAVFTRAGTPGRLDKSALNAFAPELLGGNTIAPGPMRHAARAAERDQIRRVLAECAGDRTAAARQLGISRTTLWRKLGDAT
jgi:two-component system, NtrC family, response regulator PilR